MTELAINEIQPELAANQEVRTSSRVSIPPCWIIEGIDRIGKGTLINQIQQNLGFHQVIKFAKPEKLAHYNNDLKSYQVDSYQTGFSILGRSINTNSYFIPKLIFDRFHLGEAVYSPMYRGYSGEYVFEMEKKFIADFGGPASGLFAKRVCMVLLAVNDFKHLAPDDGLSHDYSKKELEQSMFLDCFHRSKVPNKVLIWIDDLNGLKTPEQIYSELIAKASK
jgi:hypothetical protein